LQRVLLDGGLHEVDDDNSADAPAVEPGQIGSRLGELKRGGGAVKRGVDSGQELPPVTAVRPSNGGDGGGGPPGVDHPDAGGQQLPAKAILAFAGDLGLDPSDVEEYMWLCEEALSAKVLKNWEAHVDGQGNVYFFDSETETSAWDHPNLEHYHNCAL
jgi:hypothetical protein